MCTTSITWTELKARDEKIAEKVQADTVCARCGEHLNRADYRRKVRGLDFDSSEEKRISFCCSKCRKRITPPSLRFLWRKVYTLLSVTMSFESEGFLISKSRATLGRWRSFWEKHLHQQSDFISAIAGFLDVGFDFSMSSLVFGIRSNKASTMTPALRVAQCLNLLGCESSLMAHFQTHRTVRDTTY